MAFPIQLNRNACKPHSREATTSPTFIHDIFVLCFPSSVFIQKLTHYTLRYFPAHFAVSFSVSHLPAWPYEYDGGRWRRRRWRQFNWGMIMRVCFCNVQLTPPRHTHLPCLCAVRTSSIYTLHSTQYKALVCKVQRQPVLP